jgi:hypothetical protein
MIIKIKTLKMVLIIALFGIMISLVNAGSISDESSTTIIISGGVECSDEGNFWINNTNPSIPIIVNTTGPNSNCYNPNNPVFQKCCPSGFECIQKTPVQVDPKTGWNIYFCNYTGENYCWDIKTSEKCNSPTKATVLNSFKFLGKTCGNSIGWIDSSGDTCYNKTVCSCKWNAGTGKCNADSQSSRVCQNSGTTNFPTCDFVPVSWDDQCNETGFLIVQIDAIGDPSDPECIDQTKTIACEEIAKLGFFNKWNFIAAVLVLIVVYVFVERRKHL